MTPPIHTPLAMIIVAVAALTATTTTTTLAGDGPSIPEAIPHIERAIHNGNDSLAKQLLTPLVACSNPSALLLWAELHDAPSQGPQHHDRITSYYVEAAIAGNARAHLALAQRAATRNTAEGYTNAYAHLIAYGWSTGIDNSLRPAMHNIATRLSPANVLRAYEHAEALRTLEHAAAEHIPCEDAHAWI